MLDLTSQLFKIRSLLYIIAGTHTLRYIYTQYFISIKGYYSENVLEIHTYYRASLMAQMVKDLPAMRETCI